MNRPGGDFAGMKGKVIVCEPGEVSEWPKEQHWKCCNGAIRSGVRIPPSPMIVLVSLLLLKGYIHFTDAISEWAGREGGQRMAHHADRNSAVCPSNETG